MASSSVGEDATMSSKLANLKTGCYFNDGVRRIDYILVWEEDLPAADSDAAEESGRLCQYRTKFHANIARAGIAMEKEVTVTAKMRIHFLKLSVSWKAMCYYAEYLRLRAPLELRQSPTDSDCAAGVFRGSPLWQEVPNRPRGVYTCAFSAARLHKFLGSSNRDSYFTPTQRHRVAYEILATAAYGEAQHGQIGVERMLQEDVYACAFPPHEGPYQLPEDFNHEDSEFDLLDSEETAAAASSGSGCDSDGGQRPLTSLLNPRQILYAYWASWGLWYKYQPLDHVRAYFGEKIAFYFAWLGMYTSWLLPATLVGIAVFIYGLMTLSSDVPSNEACNSNRTFRMCPICDESDGCGYWYLANICWKIKLAHQFDHPGTVLYSVFVSFWAVLFLQFWKRRNSTLAHKWGVSNFHSVAEMPRPGYSIGCTEFRSDPVKGGQEPYFPHSSRVPRIVVSTGCTVLMLAVVVAFILLKILYETVISVYLFRNPQFRPTAKLIANLSAAAMHLVVMLVLEHVFQRLAQRLTEWEMHRTQSRFEDQLTVKVFIFEVCNYYSSIFYIAFVKGKLLGYPGAYRLLFGFRPEDCDEGGCLLDLALSLAVIMIGKPILANTFAIILPNLLARLHRCSKGLTTDPEDHAAFKPWEADYRLVPYYGLFREYLQSVLQFGFITIFVAAFPLAPLFALLNNWLELRLDARKLVLHTQRPLAERAQGIGAWCHLLEVIAALSVISNACLVAFTSESLPKLLYWFEHNRDLRGYVDFSLAWSPANATSQPCRYRDFRDPEGKLTPFFWRLLVVRLTFIIVLEHLVFSVSYLLTSHIRDAPKELRLQIQRENYLGREALVDAGGFQRLHRRRRGQQQQQPAPAGRRSAAAAAEAGGSAPARKRGSSVGKLSSAAAAAAAAALWSTRAFPTA